jgi:hypothetical protein
MNAIQKAIFFLRSHTMRVPMWIRLIFILGAFALPLYWAITFTGLYAEIAIWQAGIFDSQKYSGTLTYLLCALILLLPCLALIMLVGQFFPEIDPNSEKGKKVKNIL